MFRFIGSLVLGVILFAGLAWYLGLFESGDTTNNYASNGGPNKKPDLGAPLLDDAKPYPALKTGSGIRRADPVVMRGHINFKDKQDVPAIVPGQILFIGEGIPDEVVQLAGPAAFMAEPFGFNVVTIGDQKYYKFYRRLYEGEVVSNEQMVGMIDTSKALTLLAEKSRKIDFSQNEKESAKAAADEAYNRWVREKQIYAKGGGSLADLSAAEAAKVKFFYDHLSKMDGIELAKIEMKQAQLNYAQHEIRNKIPYRHCVIKQIYKQVGDAVKEQETIMTLLSLDNLMAEAMVEVQYLNRMRKEMNVIIEPTQDEAPLHKLPGAHRGEVAAVAFTNDQDRPRLVSGGSDRLVSVWDFLTDALPIHLRHDDAVQSLACSPLGTNHDLCLSGCADGKVFIWDVNRDKLAANNGSQTATKSFKAHEDAVTALAFSPKGDYFASGSADGSIALWRTDGKLVYAFPSDQAHSGTVTALHFTPQGRLVSASRDNTIRIWHVKEKGAELDGDPVDGRGGNVGQLDVSPDGKFFLFDRGRSLQLMSLQNPTVTAATVQNPGASTPFETLALFSPDSQLMLTAGASEGRLQLWKAPTEVVRGYEVRQFVPEEKLPATCAAFAPAAPKGGSHAFAGSGSINGYVYVWALPTPQEVATHRIKDVHIRVVSANLDPNTRQTRIAVEVPNPATAAYPKGRLVPGRPVTIVIGEE